MQNASDSSHATIANTTLVKEYFHEFESEHKENKNADAQNYGPSTVKESMAPLPSEKKDWTS